MTILVTAIKVVTRLAAVAQREPRAEVLMAAARWVTANAAVQRGSGCQWLQA